MALNPEQQKAIETTEGRLLVLAGAGSGKTSVITHRIAHLIAKGVDPTAILGMTFTNKAAEEMRSRVAKLTSRENAKKITLCTFHSFCMRVLRSEIHHLGYTAKFTLYDEKDVKRLVKQLSRQLLEHEGEMPSIEPTFEMIREAKSKGELNASGSTWHDGFVEKLYSQLEVSLRAHNAVDFDSLISLTVQLFEKFPDILKMYATRFRYIMIDEYQDTNPMQYKLADFLSSVHNNLCVVGDDDQSIYGWRGAEIKHILEFTSTHVIKLEQNYRSTSNILQGANGVISHNKERHEKRLWSKKGEGEQIHLFHAPTDTEEATAVIDRLIHLKSQRNLQWKDMAILYRSNILSRQFEVALMGALWKKDDSWKRGIPYQVFGGTELFERSEIKDVMAYLRTVVNPLDGEAILRIINFPRRGISATTLDTLTNANRSRNMPLWSLLQRIAKGLDGELECDLTKQGVQGITLFVSLIENAMQEFETLPMHEALSNLLDAIGFKQSIHEEVKSEKMRGFKWENVQECITLLKDYEDSEDSPTLEDFLATTYLDTQKMQRKKKGFTEDKVTLMTFHSAKGLEFPACFLVCLEDHVIPHEKSLMETGLEEERRLMYVAMTRAQKYLTLSMARKRTKHGKDLPTNPSRFLFEIPKSLLKVTSWNIPTGY